jgi:DNA-binding transcriptional LysR family regulator
MELRHIRYFVAVAEELDITKAAMRLNVSQPPLSRQIRDLEDELGMVLLERSPKEVRLAHAGGVFFKDARGVLQHAAEAVRKARAILRAKAAELRIGYAPSPTVEILPRRGAPRACVQLLDQSTEQSLSALSAGTIDVALVVQPPLKGARGLVFEKLLELPVGIVPPEHPFARRRCVRLSPAAPPLAVGYVVRAAHRSEILEKFINALQFITRGSGSTTRTTQPDAHLP